MIRHLPKAPPKRYSVTGNYIYDYQANEFGMGGSVQALFIGNSKTHLPQIGFFKLEQEALGKYTDQYAVNQRAIFLSSKYITSQSAPVVYQSERIR